GQFHRIALPAQAEVFAVHHFQRHRFRLPVGNHHRDTRFGLRKVAFHVRYRLGRDRLYRAAECTLTQVIDRGHTEQVGAVVLQADHQRTRRRRRLTVRCRPGRTAVARVLDHVVRHRRDRTCRCRPFQHHLPVASRGRKARRRARKGAHREAYHRFVARGVRNGKCVFARLRDRRIRGVRLTVQRGRAFVEGRGDRPVVYRIIRNARYHRRGGIRHFAGYRETYHRFITRGVRNHQRVFAVGRHRSARSERLAVQRSRTFYEYRSDRHIVRYSILNIRNHRRAIVERDTAAVRRFRYVYGRVAHGINKPTDYKCYRPANIRCPQLVSSLPKKTIRIFRHYGSLLATNGNCWLFDGFRRLETQCQVIAYRCCRVCQFVGRGDGYLRQYRTDCIH